MDKRYTYSVLNQALYHVNVALSSGVSSERHELLSYVDSLAPFNISIHNGSHYQYTVRFENGALIIKDHFQDSLSREIEINLSELENLVNSPKTMINNFLDKLYVLSK